MVTEYGMSPKIGPLSFGGDGFRGPERRLLYPGAAPELSDDLAALVDEEISRLVNEAHDRATEVLTRHRELLEKLSEHPDRHRGDRRPRPPGVLRRDEADPLVRRARAGGRENGGRRGEGEGAGPTGPDIVLQPPVRG